MYTFLPFFTSLGISAVAVPFVMKLANRHDIYDKPDHDRKIHTNSTPLLGGLAIYLGFIITFLIFAKLDRSTLAFIMTSFIILITGILDDIYNVPARLRLLIEAICAFYIAIVSTRINVGQYIFNSDILIFLIDVSVTILWIVGIINAVNLIDGVDGLAGGVVTIAALGFAIIGHVTSDNTMLMMALILIGAVIGFLIYNKNPAKIFMGDAGSMFLGYILSILSIMSMDLPNNAGSLFAPIIILVTPIFDTGCAILRRLFSKKKIFTADRGHIHHRLLDKGYSQRKTVYIIYGISIISLIVGLIVYIGQYFMVGFLIVSSLVILGVVMSLRIVQKEQLTMQYRVVINRENRQITR